MIAFIVCVDYSDLLRITLPQNINHFEQVVVVTAHRDVKTIDFISDTIAPFERVSLCMTDAFYADGAHFNKWKALDHALEIYAFGWVVLLDADILLPKFLPELNLTIGNLYSPFRRMVQHNGPYVVPHDSHFDQFVRHEEKEFAGYCQIFHSSDPVLGPHPWHQQNWTHAGGADTFFQMKWPEEKKIRPPFEVLHFGFPAQNWCGVGKIHELQAMMSKRKGKPQTLERYRNELI